ncbi:MAG: Fe-S cluster assembly protein SufD [Woeseia sp.]|nr:Fe-S cluster assembly protein SufD [Woeseia sp.]
MTSTVINQDLFTAAVEGLPPGQLSSHRSDAAKLFSVTGFPTARDEDWKYTRLDGAADLSNDWLASLAQHSTSTEASVMLTDAQLAPTQSINADWIIVHNGIVDAAALGQLKLPTGVNVSLIGEDSEHLALTTDSPMSAFNAALLTDGLRVRVANNVAVKKPLGFLMVDDDRSRVTQIRVVLELGDNAALRVVECALSSGVGPTFTNSVTQLQLAEGSKLDFLRLQNHALDHISTNRFVANIDKDATFTHNNFDFGGDLTRNDIVAIIEGAGASVNLAGLYLASGAQHIDNHTRVEHRVGPAVSHEEYRGILNGKSRCVFNGQAVVFEGADGTDANQANHNLLLSDQAEIDTKPELEIYADDVKCSHGATVGQLDETALFYLRSRGLDTTEARRLLTQAFAANILNLLAIDEAREYVKLQLDERVASLLGDERT